ncbi:hypothetical protein EJB05_21176, partial [Eragrostis curvula]
MTVVDGEMAVFFQIRVFVWDDDPRWWNLWLFEGLLFPINGGVGVDWDATLPLMFLIILHNSQPIIPVGGVS